MNDEKKTYLFGEMPISKAVMQLSVPTVILATAAVMKLRKIMKE